MDPIVPVVEPLLQTGIVVRVQSSDPISSSHSQGLVMDSISALDRLKLSGLLSQAVRTLKAAGAPLTRLQAAADVRRLLTQLRGEQPADVKPLIRFSLDEKAASSASLVAYMEDGFKALPESLRRFEAITVYELAESVEDRATAHAAKLLSSTSPVLVDAAYVSAYEEISSRGVKPDIDTASVMARAAEADAICRQSVASSFEFVEANEVLAAMNARVHAEQISYRSQIATARAAQDLFLVRKLEDDQAAAYEKYTKDFAAQVEKANSVKRAFEADRAKRALDLFAVEGEAVLSAIMAASPVSAERAAAWASRQVVDDNAIAKLSRMGYKKDALYRDLAEFYRLTGGKASAIRISINGSKRANAVGVATRLDEKIINLGSRFDKTVLFHELAHHLENDPIAKAASNGYLIKRREGNEVHSLRQLSGNKGYGPGELAFKDAFMDVYIGKFYRDRITEVFSMGVQYLANPKDAAIFAAKDPEMFALITGYLTSELSPAMDAKLHMHSGVTDEIQAKRQDESTQYEATVDSMAQRVTLEEDGWWAGLKAFDGYNKGLIESYAFERGVHPNYIGGYGNYHVFEGTFRNKNTKRKAKGHLVVRMDDARAVPDYAPVHGGLNKAKALIVLADTNGTSVSQTWYAYFYEKMRKNVKKAVIDAGQTILGAVN